MINTKNNVCVYRHRRLDTNEVFYIGIGLKHRPSDIKNRNKYWNNIVNKTKYKIDILYDNISWEDACELETLIINLYGRKDLKLGLLCNLTDGGEGSYGRVISDKTRIKMSKSMKGKPGTFKGKKHTPESILKMSELRKNVPAYLKKIINKNNNIIYKSCTEAAIDLGIHTSTLSYHLNKENNKFNIEYYND